VSPEWVTAIATVFTALVIAASAAAALMQIRHMRKGNEIEIMQKWTETIESAEFESARAFVTHELRRILADPQKVHALTWNPLPPELGAVRVICNHFEAIGAFVKLGSVDARVAVELWSSVVHDCWQAMAPVIAVVRKRLGRDGVWENFEYLAVLSERYLNSHPTGTYPHGTPRMAVDTSVIAILEAPAERG
jgi:hypothetical protein